MANVRCPMCSKINPPDAETCGYCGARLKPVRPSAGTPAGSGSTSPKPASGPGAPSEGGEPDWLLSLRSDEPSTPADSGPAAPGGAGAPGAAGDENEDMPDWLSRIRQRARSETSAPEDLFGQAQDEEQDWLKGSAQEPSAEQGGDLLDRLNPIAGQPPAAAEPGAGGLDLDSWLQGLSGDQPTQVEPTPGQPSGPVDQSPAGEDDWMKNLAAWQSGGGAEPETGAEPPSTGEAQDDFSWINSLTEEPGAPAPEPGAADSTSFDFSGFLSNLDQPPAQSEPPAPPAKEPGRESSGFGLTGFLSDLEQQQAGQPSESQPETPVWQPPQEQEQQPEEGGLEWNQSGQAEAPLDLSGFLSNLQEPAAPETGEYAENAFPGWEDVEKNAPQEGLPDWLMGGASTPETPAAPEAPQPAESADLPDWLRDLEAEAARLEQPKQPVEPVAPPLAQQPPAAQPPAEPPGEAGLPDWLKGPAAETPAPADRVPPASADVNLPAWLAGLNEEASASQNLPSANQPPAANEPPLAPQNAPEAEVPPENVLQFNAAPTPDAEELPDWFSQLEPPDIEKTQPRRTTGELKTEKEPPQSAAAPQPFASAPTGSEESGLPDWLRDFNAPASDEESGPSVPPLVGGEEFTAAPAEPGEQPFAVELPDWLEEDAAARDAAAAMNAAAASAAQPGERPLGESGSEELAQADLPEWVKDMRPIESIIPGEAQMAEADQRVEKAGPLAGMRGVLPAEDLVTRFRKPSAYSIKLRVTEKQRGQSDIFDRILTQESQPLLIPPARSHAPGTLLRILVALALIFALFVPIFLGGSFAPLAAPVLYPPDLLQMFDRIDQGTSSNTPVLLAVDYEPGLSGEMRLASTAVIDHLAKKNVPIVVISTVPTGPALAEQLLSQAQSSNAQYDLAQKTVNLGYLPGGTISLLEFARQPQIAAPVTLAGQLAWQETFLKNISGLSGFSQIIVLTDRAETGRSWVEQVQPYIGNIPLFMVTSAQAAPMLYPYVEGGQIAGLVSGLLGGAMYAQRAGQTNNPAMNYLAAYQVGMTIAVLVVVIGGLVSGGMVLFKRGAKDEE